MEILIIHQQSKCIQLKHLYHGNDKIKATWICHLATWICTQGIDDTVSGVPTDFNLKYGVSIDIKEEIIIEKYAEAIASEVGNNAILFANKKNGKLIMYFTSVSHCHSLVNSNPYY